ncbi:aminoglycoside phosphotransferase family protein [Catenulispora yoronensis]
MPRIEWAVGSLRREQRWLPVLGPLLPLEVPVPAGVGAPIEEYPYPWSVLPWIEGEPAVRTDHSIDRVTCAVDLAHFLKALQAIDTTGAPAPTESGRGRAITDRDQEVREAVAALGSEIDADAVLAVWKQTMDAPAWPGKPVWIHSDLQGGNLLVREGRLRAVIDFAPATGDPAVDLLPAWNLFHGEARDAFRSALGVDDATWERGRGWALSVALVALPYYLGLGTNPRIVADSRHDIQAILDAQ